MSRRLQRMIVPAVIAAGFTAAPATAGAWSLSSLLRGASGGGTGAQVDVGTGGASVDVDTGIGVGVDVDVDTGLEPEPAGCPATDSRQAFAQFGDDAEYSLAPGGAFESAAGWSLRGGAKIAGGNEDLGVEPGSHSLVLPLGASAVSPAFCVDSSHPHFRFAAKPDSAVAGYKAIVLYRDAAGTQRQAQFTSSASQSWGPGDWAPSSTSPLGTAIPLVQDGGTASVQIKFVATGNEAAVGVGLWGRFAGAAIGTVRFDSLMIDPYRRG